MNKQRSPKLIIICGLSFSGKSTLGKAISKSFGYPEVDVDDTKYLLHGRAIKDADLNREQWNNIYEDTDKQIENALRFGKTVIDASRNFRKIERQKIGGTVRMLNAELVTIYVDTPEPIVRQRWLENKKRQLRHDVTDKDFQDIITAMEPPDAGENPLIFHYEDNITRWISEHTAALDTSPSSSAPRQRPPSSAE